MARTREFEALLSACLQKGCSICRLAEESTFRYLDNWKYELFTDVDLRLELRRTRGFCHLHTWQLVDMGASIQLAQTYREILSDELEQLQRGSNTPAGSGFLQRFFEGRHADNKDTVCPACQQRALSEERSAQEFRQALLDKEFYRTFTHSQGLCMEHFRLVSEPKTGDASASEWLPLLRKAQITCLQRIDRQLGELIRKHDYRFKDEVRGEEMISWKRAAGLVAGEEQQMSSH